MTLEMKRVPDDICGIINPIFNNRNWIKQFRSYAGDSHRYITVPFGEYNVTGYFKRYFGKSGPSLSSFHVIEITTKDVTIFKDDLLEFNSELSLKQLEEHAIKIMLLLV